MRPLWRQNLKEKLLFPFQQMKRKGLLLLYQTQEVVERITRKSLKIIRAKFSRIKANYKDVTCQIIPQYRWRIARS